MEEKKVVLITGCSSGFGYLTALKFARNGWQTFASVRELEGQGAKELWEIRDKENLSLQILPIDVNSSSSVEEGARLVKNKFGRIDVLVNNAGFGFLGPVEEFSIDEVRQQYETNVFGVLRLVKAVAPMMRAQKSGHIINLSSIAGLVTFPLYGVYSSSKRALEALSEDLRFNLSHFGIQVSLVEPGSFHTRFSDNRKMPQSYMAESSPYKDLVEKFNTRFRKIQKEIFTHSGDPQQVANLVYKIANQTKPSVRYLVGRDAQLYYYLRKFTPDFIWEYILHRIYKW